MNKKIFAVLTAVMMILCFIPAAAEGDEITVTVTLSNAGSVEIAAEQITVKDIDNDGVFTVNDVLYCAHKAKYTGGASAGYGSVNGSWGLSITKLWGNTSGSYGYYVNDTMAMSLEDTVKSGDRINAFVYKDAAGYSDIYCFFDKQSVAVKQGESIEVILKKITFDGNWQPVAVPAENAHITVNGTDTGIKTDSEGKATVTLDSAGNALISALGDGNTILVPPVIKAEVAAVEPENPVLNNTENSDNENKSPKTGEALNYEIISLLILSAFACFVLKRLPSKSK